jgi:hypothetical protein
MLMIHRPRLADKTGQPWTKMVPNCGDVAVKTRADVGARTRDLILTMRALLVALYL